MPFKGKSPELSSEEKVKSDALRLLSVRPRSVEELRGRLKFKRHDGPAVDSVIELLTKQGLLDDEKFARLFAGSKTATKPVGKKQLALDLKRKGLSPRIIQGTLENLGDYDEKEAVRKLAQNRFSRMSGLTPQKAKARLFGFLKRRGFSNDAIFSALSEVIKDGSIES